VVAHGQMAERALEKAMRTFLGGDADVLLATAIIENGLDIPNANTLLVNRADRFGLAQLYQLRGRVGRSERLAFAYFLVPPGQALSQTARARLAAIQEFCELGRASDRRARLEIRGAGNLLGAEQHGFMEAVGFETYCRLLEEAVRARGTRAADSARGRAAARPRAAAAGVVHTEPSLGCPSTSASRRCRRPRAGGAARRGRRPLRAGAPPAANLLAAQRLRVAAQRAGVASVVRRDSEWRVQLDSTAPAPLELGAIVGRRTDVRVTPTGEIRLPIASDDSLDGVRALLETWRGARGRVSLRARARSATIGTVSTHGDSISAPASR